MKIYHVTDMGNLPGILKLGLQPAKPRLPHHKKCFDELYRTVDQRAPEKYIYAWEFKTEKRTEKIAKDVAYWHVWGWRLNDMVTRLVGPGGKGDRIDLPDRRHPEMETAVFAVLTAHVPKTPHWVLGPEYFTHRQEVKEMSHRAYGRMDPRRQHVEPLVLITQPISAHLLRLWATVIVHVERKNRRWHLTTTIHRYATSKPLMRKPS